MGRSTRAGERLYFCVGDYLAGSLTGLLTAFAVRAVIGPQWDMVVAMFVGMAVGMVIHLSLLLLIIPFLGTFEAMMPSAVIGMYGGMLFGMRDSMQQTYVSLNTALAVGAFFGLVVVIGTRWWDRQLRGVVFAKPDSHPPS
jgi:hypothetical protein